MDSVLWGLGSLHVVGFFWLVGFFEGMVLVCFFEV